MGWGEAGSCSKAEVQKREISYVLSSYSGLIYYKDTNAKYRHLKGTLSQMFIGVYGLERQSVMLVFSTQLCETVDPL